MPKVKTNLWKGLYRLYGDKNRSMLSQLIWPLQNQKKDGIFTITAKNLQGFDGYKEVKIPFWSHANGMKDIIWYTPTRQADGSYTVTAKASDHENSDGKYESAGLLCRCQRSKQVCQESLIDYTAPKPSAWRLGVYQMMSFIPLAWDQNGIFTSS